jgi:hypothetical protein
MFIKCVGAYVKLTPFDRVKNQLIAKIKEIYLPDQATVAGIATKLNQLDFTGAADDEPVKKASKKMKDDDDDEEDFPAKKKPAAGGLPDFT